jgi:hypothetical protein
VGWGTGCDPGGVKVVPGRGFSYLPGGLHVQEEARIKSIIAENVKLKSACSSFWKLLNNCNQRCSDEVGETVVNECIWKLQQLANYYESKGSSL